MNWYSCKTAARGNFKVIWLNPDSGKWDTYQDGLSQAAAQRLALKVEYELSPRWFNRNVPAKAIQMDPAPTPPPGPQNPVAPSGTQPGGL